MKRVGPHFEPWHAQQKRVAEASRLSSTQIQRQDRTPTSDQVTSREMQPTTDGNECVPLAIVHHGNDRKPNAIAEELNEVLV